MQELRELRSAIHEEAKRLRNIDYILGRPSFENLWVLSDEPQKLRLKAALMSKHKDAIINWYKSHPLIDIGEQTLIQLRETAKEMCIHNYSRLSKIELLVAVKSAKINPVSPIEHPLENGEMIIEIRRLCDLMNSILIEANIPEDYLDFPEDAKYFEQHIIEVAHRWILGIYNKEYREAKAIKSLLSEEMWERYRTWADFGDHREVVLLTEAIQKLRKVVMIGSRPELFKKASQKSMLHRLKRMRGDD